MFRSNRNKAASSLDQHYNPDNGICFEITHKDENYQQYFYGSRANAEFLELTETSTKAVMKNSADDDGYVKPV